MEPIELLWRQFGSPVVRFVKIDVEGFEPRVQGFPPIEDVPCPASQSIEMFSSQGSAVNVMQLLLQCRSGVRTYEKGP